MKILKGLHTFYGLIIFSVLFFLFFFLLLIPILDKRKYKLVGIFNRWWAKSLFFFIGIPCSVEYRYILLLF